ncbi:hypothetical protein LAB1_45280 [Roseibium sp. LAB1]
MRLTPPPAAGGDSKIWEGKTTWTGLQSDWSMDETLLLKYDSPTEDRSEALV